MADLEWLLDVGGNAKSVLADVDAVLAVMPRDLTKVEAGLKAFDRAIAAANIAKLNDPLRQNAALLKLHAQSLKEDAAAADKAAASQRHHEDAVRKEAAAQEKANEQLRLSKAKDAAKDANELGSAIANAFGVGQIASIAGVAGAIGLVGGAVKGAMSFLGHGAIELFKFGLEAQQGKRAMMGMLQVFEGAGTDNAFSVMQDMGIAAGQSADKMVQAFAGLRTAGFNAKESQDILAASMDISAAKGGGDAGKAAADKFQDLFVKFNALGKVGSKDLLALARDVGIDPTKQLPEALAARMRVPVDQAIKLLDAGKADAKTVENALLDIVQKDINKGGALGDFAKDFAAGDMPSQLQRIKDMVSNLFEDANFKPAVGFVKNIADALEVAKNHGDPLKALAERFVGLIGGIDNFNVGTALEGAIEILDVLITDAEKLKAGFGEAFHPETLQQTKELLDMVDVVLGKTGEKSDSIHGIGVAFGMVANHIAMSVALLEKLIELAARAASSIAGAVQSIGQFGGDVGGGFAKGIEQGDGGAVWDAAVKMAKLPLKAVTGTLDIHSPSREMAKLGAHAGEGFSEGLDSKSPDAAIAAAVSTPTISTTNNSSRGGMVVNVSFGDIIAGGEPGRVREDARAGVLEALEEMGYS